MLRKRILIIIVLICALLSKFSYAKDLGVVGNTYPILEEDFLEFIQNRIQTMQENGEWQKIQNQMQKRAQIHADRPKPLYKITKTIQQKEWLFDPSTILSSDLKDHQGRVFAKSGTTFNPLNRVSLRYVLIFLDGDDEKQVVWVKNKIEVLKTPTKLILVNGSIFNAEKIFKQRIYFDQEGHLTQHFNIRHVPAIVMQEDLRLKITEEVI